MALYSRDAPIRRWPIIDVTFLP